VVAVYLLNAKSGKVGPDGRYNMANGEDVCQFLTDEFGVRKFGIATMISGTSHGAKYLLDLTEEQDSTIADLPAEAIKLAKGVGLELTKLGDPRQSIVMTANLPSWEDVGILASALGSLKWVRKVGDVKRVKMGEGKITTNHVNFVVTPREGQKVDDAFFPGVTFERGYPITEDLL